MDAVITEYDFEIMKRRIMKERECVDSFVKSFLSHMPDLLACQLDLENRPIFDVIMVGPNEYKVYVPINLGREVAIYFHKHAPCKVLIQTGGKVLETWQECIHEDGFLSSVSANATLNLHLGHAFDGYIHSVDCKIARDTYKLSNVAMSYINVLQIITEFGITDIQIVPAIKVDRRHANWFLKDYTSSVTYVVAKGGSVNREGSPDLVWTLDFSETEAEIEQKYQRLFLISVLFVDKFKLKSVGRDEIMQVLLRIDGKYNGNRKAFPAVLSTLKDMLSSRCMYNFHVKEKLNLIQFPNEADVIRTLDVIGKYLKCFQR